MRRNTTLLLLLCGALLLASCTDLVQTDPNQQTTASFFEDEDDALQSLFAVYNNLQNEGTYSRWLYFAYDLRSDLGESNSPNSALVNFSSFSFNNFNIPVNFQTWTRHYRSIFRANQVIERVPDIDMDPEQRSRIVAEAKFLRALFYFNLVALYENIPLILEVSEPQDRPPGVSPEEVWAQIEADLQEVQDVLPVEYNASQRGRATRGAATALLGKAHLQQQEWAEAAAAFEQVIDSPAGYGLLDDYAGNFDDVNENHRESVFSVQFTDDSQLGTGARGSNRPNFLGPRGPTFADGQPTRWFFEQFFEDGAVGDTAAADPRLDATIFWNRPGGMEVYGIPYTQRYGANADVIYWKKYTEFEQTTQDFQSDINFQVIRFADVLLMYAEALNEMGRTSEAYAPVDRVRERVGLTPLSEAAPGLSQAQMRERIAHERILELGGESVRLLYLKRHGLFGPGLADHDPEFQFFEEGTSERLPIPLTEVDLNPNLDQNPGY